MANSLMADVLQNYNRPVHFANLENKVPCPNNLCKGITAFYKKHGLQHHFRIRQPDVQYVGEKIEHDASNMMKKLHGNETRLLIEKIFEMRRKQVCIYILGSFT
jgi:hypothetical protein